MNESKISKIKFNDIDPNYKITFKEAIARFWKGYFKFSGRATRCEFWWAMLFYFLVSIAIGIISFLVLQFGTEEVLYRDSWGDPYLSTRVSDWSIVLVYGTSIIWGLSTFFPWVALYVRRGHDCGCMGLHTILGLIMPILNIFTLCELFFKDSDRRKNDYGDSEKYPDEPKKPVVKKTICEVKDSICPHCGKKIRVSLIVETADNNS